MNQNNKDVAVKILKFIQKTGIIRRTLKPSQVQTHSRMNILELPTFLYGCETWAIRGQDKCEITSAEMKFMR